MPHHLCLFLGHFLGSLVSFFPVSLVSFYSLRDNSLERKPFFAGRPWLAKRLPGLGRFFQYGFGLGLLFWGFGQGVLLLLLGLLLLGFRPAFRPFQVSALIQACLSFLLGFRGRFTPFRF